MARIKISISERINTEYLKEVVHEIAFEVSRNLVLIFWRILQVQLGKHLSDKMSYKNTQKKRSSGCGQNYYSVDDILAKHEKLPCKVEMPIHRLGKLIRKKMNL